MTPIRDELIEIVVSDLKRQEGFRQFPYLDTVDVETIGYGRNLKANGITEDEAEYLLRNDVLRTVDALRWKLPWIDYLTVTRQAVLVNMAYNLGVRGLLKFQHTLAAVQEGRYQEAAAQMLNLKWANQVGDRAVELAGIMAGEGLQTDITEDLLGG